MDKEIIISAINKVHDNKELSEDELKELVEFLYSGMFLNDIPDENKENLLQSNTKNIHIEYRKAIISSIERIFKMRYGL